MAKLQFNKVESKGGTTFIKAKDLEAGNVPIDGFEYTGSTESKDYPGAFTHYFKDEEGASYGLSGTASLNRLMESVTVGQLVQVQYEGSQILESGRMKGKACHMWQVLTAQEESEAV